MNCPSCAHPNRDGARFCAECGASLSEPLACRRCGRENPGDARFCDACGEALSSGQEHGPEGEPAVPPPDRRSITPAHLATKIRSSRRALEGERKQVTVLFADVMGSMELAERTDPESWRGLMDRFFAILCEGIHRFEGTVDKFTGDGIMAIFGAPIAHEDHAQRACYAALHLQQELAGYTAELRRSEGVNFSVRIGIHSGEVVVGSIGEDLGMEYTAVGHTVGLAQRIEQLAEPGKAYLTRYTAALVEGYLLLDDLGEFEVKGAREPLQVYELKGVGSARGRLDISQARGFSRFVGRSEEMKVLDEALERSLAGEAQVIGIVGEAGVGKSRLCHEFTERKRAQGLPVSSAAGQAHAKSVPLVPVLQVMRNYFGITEGDSDQKARERIAGKLLLLEESFVDVLPLVFDFLAVSDPERPSPRMDPEARQRQLLGFMEQMIHARSEREPGIHLLEDLHWLDPASEIFLANHVTAIQGTRSLTIVNFRPEYHAGWMAEPHYRQIALTPLEPGAIDELVTHLLGTDPSLEGLPRLVRERTAGNPFFIEELLKSLEEAGTLIGEHGAYRLAAPIENTAVPASVQSVLAARIDRLPEREKEVLQAAAVIGKEFPEPVLGGVAELAASELEEALCELVAGEFVFEQELYPEALYAFRHPLTHEVAYHSQLGERRGRLHAATARAMAEQYPDRLDERSALLAQHWEAAGEALEAARWHARAGAWAGTSDPNQSLRHWRKVRELADSLEESEEATMLGLTARIFWLQFAWRLGLSREEAEAVYLEGERMALEAGDQRSRVLLLALYGAIRGVNDGEPAEQARVGREAIALAEEVGDPALYMVAALDVYGLFMTGELREAVAIVDRAIELADGDATLGAGIAVGCPLAYFLMLKGGLVCTMGQITLARELLERGMDMAREHGDLEQVGWGHMWSTWLAYFTGDSQAAYTHARESLEIAERIGDAFSRTFSWHWLGLAELMRGEWARARDAIERSIALANERRTGMESQGLRLAALSEAYVGLGELDVGRTLAREGIGVARAAGAVPNELFAILALVRAMFASPGELAHEEVAAKLERALELIRKSEAMAFEPLVRTELAELARRRGDDESHERELRAAERLYAEIGASGR
ncbi:MAG: AAA family ATPase [Thermoleophilaceae bacterium]|nr:AAA family ATPase [Thermoleophilaceae bacterium]